ncbi:protein rolling stone-like [Mizuhopecten yessoensis]|uniref:Protein rolling stone n=1 Tax=Mizuhopecten yessoensis TaxID=6573 RepID=A0A210QWV9_MIZYE|nr:protein rolling stone-like [Mizuhopecten yessoensis]OWF53225.1 Protein rolling stone [Mizuhopecten yessoensis]
MCDVLKREFSWSNFRLSHQYKTDFFTSQWRWHPYVFLIVRSLLAAYSIASLSAVLAEGGGPQNIMVYLTIWTYLTLTLHFLLAAVLAFVCTCCTRYGEDHTNSIVLTRVKSEPVKAVNGSFQKDDGQQVSNTDVSVGISSTANLETGNAPSVAQFLPWHFQVCWLVSIVAQHFTIVVTIVYFTALFPFMGIQGIAVNDINMHGISTVLVLLDVAVSARPVRILHVIYPMIYGVAYAVFNVIYWSEDKVHNVVYNIMDWNNPGLAVGIVVGLAFVLVPLIQLFHFGLYRLRLHLYDRIYHTK